MKKYRDLILFTSLLSLFYLSHQPVYANEIVYPEYNTLFDVPEGMRTNVNFWKDIYTKYTTDYIVIHDERYVDIIYDVIDMRKHFKYSNITDRIKRRKIKEIKKRYVRMIKKIGKGNFKKNGLSDKEMQIYKMLKARYSNKRLRKAYRYVRAQVGQSDRFLEGLKKSGLYIDKMKAIFMSFDLPIELTVLPHVESSFNYNAYSRFGAAGIWQFTHSTGRRFMKINYEIDERRDPITSTIAAAKLLKENYEKLGSWPLAVTAYNHGLYGMKRAKRLVGNNIVDIIEKYRSRIFGFASRNFYAEFLAALDVVRNYKKYFGDIIIENPLKYDIFKLDYYVDISTLSQYLDIGIDDMHFFNPSMRLSILESKKFIPKGFNLKIPQGKLKEVYASYAMIPPDKKFFKQKRSKWYKVRRGDNLARIAGRFNTTINELKGLNLIRNSHRIYPGQILQIPPPIVMTSRSSFKVKESEIPDKYTVKRGDSLSKIALRFNVDIQRLKQTNKVKNVNFLGEGQILHIPKGDKEDRVFATAEVNTGDGSSGENILVSAVYKANFKFTDKPEDDKSIKWIEVEPDETLGHYSDWSNMPTWRLRRLNDLSYRESINIGQSVKISFENSSPEVFETKRREYHKGIEEDFFSNFKIEKVITYTLEKGDTVWDICSDNEIPYWLLKGYNSDKNLSNLIAGEALAVPVLSEIK